MEPAFELERQALIASGLREKNRVSEYLDKLSSILSRFMSAGVCRFLSRLGQDTFSLGCGKTTPNVTSVKVTID